MVDPVELGLVEVLVDLLVERARRGGVVPERLLHHHARRLGHAGPGQSLDHHPEQRRRDLQVEDRAARIARWRGHPLVGRVVGEVAGHVGESRGEAVEDLVVDRLAGVGDAVPGVVAQLLDGPVVARHSQDRAVQQAAALQPVERLERHHPGQVAGDTEDHEHVGGLHAGQI